MSENKSNHLYTIRTFSVVDSNEEHDLSQPVPDFIQPYVSILNKYIDFNKITWGSATHPMIFHELKRKSPQTTTSSAISPLTSKTISDAEKKQLISLLQTTIQSDKLYGQQEYIVQIYFGANDKEPFIIIESV